MKQTIRQQGVEQLRAWRRRGMTIAADILQIACPLCTRLMKDHPGMIADVIVIPVAFVSRHTHLAYLTGVCEHSREIRGPYFDTKAADEAWKLKVQILAEQKAKQRAELDATLQRIHAKSEKDIDRNADPADKVGAERGEEARNDVQQLPELQPSDCEAEYADAHGGPGAPSVSAGMCQVSNQIYQRHDFALSGVCKRCGYKMKTI